jgi:ribosomal-protein-alanine N-acetyltransferase
MPSAFHLRTAEEKDLPIILQLEISTYPFPWTQKQFELELVQPHSYFLVAEKKSDLKIAGYAVFWMMYDECQMINLTVDVDCRGLNIAKWFIRKGMKNAFQNGLDKLTLEVRKSNISAIFLYQNIGFATIGVRKGMYSDGEDAYFMELLLRI